MTIVLALHPMHCLTHTAMPHALKLNNTRKKQLLQSLLHLYNFMALRSIKHHNV